MNAPAPAPFHPPVTILTAVMDNYDTLKPVCPQEGADVEWVCLTDSKALHDECEPFLNGDTGYGVYVNGLRHPTGWRIMYYPRHVIEHPNRAAKRPKVHPGMYTATGGSVWVDASFRVVSPRFAVEALAVANSTPSGIAQFVHPWRTCLYAEAVASMTLPKYAEERDVIQQQATAYSDAGMPQDYGLWATGVIARWHRPDVLRWGDRWAKEIRTHSYQDQISHPFVCWSTGLRPADLPGTHFANDWVQYEGSGRH